MERKKEVLESLADWIIQVTDKKELATPEEIAALPEVAEVFLKHHSSSVFPLPVKKE